MKMVFQKVEGCGNDFLLFDAYHESGLSFSNEEVQYLCDRHYGIGADGFFVLRKSEVAQAAWTFYNSDGSEAEMCGNASRCAIRYLRDRYFPDQKEPISLETRAGVLKGKVLEKNYVEVTLLPGKSASFEIEQQTIKAENEILEASCINTGVPHAVIEVKDIASYPITRISKIVQAHPRFEREGTNVTFFQKVRDRKIFSTTFERGVNEQTLACGTGAAAAAIVYVESYMSSFPVEVEVPGGILTLAQSPISKVLLLQGTAHYVFETVLEGFPREYKKAVLFGEGRKRK